ncbi:choice-of-anchor Q domain-containing protein [Nocardioides terrisoli]|uniref:choice-of-anchor Q domain-containing protein n=1 Tax=Nocardioides terrisoli TaxID=3388267 RepID=UPI00287B70C2|nr:choice-of-anchor Q domain-containing protein [Nocardioides marmorisolisilvae]
MHLSALRARVAVLALALAGGLVALGPAPSSYAGSGIEGYPTDPNIIVACGRGTVSTGGPACLTLPEALAAALKQNNAQVGPVTIELLPGAYCPISIAPPTGSTIYRSIALVGIGPGAFLDEPGPVVQNVPDAEMASFTWDSSCGHDVPNAMISAYDGPTSSYGAVTLRNLTVDGSGAGAPAIGISAGNTNLDLRDVVAQNFTSKGVSFYGDPDYSEMQVDGSLFTANQTGVDAAGEYSIDESTFTGNTGAGLENDGNGNLANDTIMGNGVGIDSSAPLAAVNTIVVDNPDGANTANCNGSGWESGGGASGNNLVDGNCTLMTGENPDIVPNGPITKVQFFSENGGPTPTIISPGDARGRGVSGWCGLTDQREFRQASNGCDIGAYNAQVGEVAATVTPSGGDLGQVRIGSTATGGVHLSAVTGANYLGDVSIGGPDASSFQLTPTGNSCSLAVLVPEEFGGGGCDVGVSASPGALRDYHAVLTIKALSGDVKVPLTMAGVPPQPTTLSVTRFDDPDGHGICYGDYPGYTADSCSLREAVAAVAPGGTITLPKGTYTLTQGQLDLAQALTVDGAGARLTTIKQSSAGDRVVDVGVVGVTVDGVTLRGGSGVEQGGGAEVEGSLVLDHSTVTGNTATDAGGGIFVDGGRLDVRHSTVAANTVTSGVGAGIGAQFGSLKLTNSTVAGNSATGAGSAGGGLFLLAADAELGFSTIAGNTVDAGGHGAGVYLATAQEGEGRPAQAGASIGFAAQLKLADTAIASNKAGSTTANCAADDPVASVIESDGHNLSDDTSCALSAADHDIVGVPAGLGALADNGGPTDTLLPARTSPAIGAAGDTDCAGAAFRVDQRGTARPETGCDIGAVDPRTAPPRATTLTPSTAMHSTIGYGGHLTVRTVLSAGGPVRGAQVQLCSRMGTTGAFGSCHASTTNASGAASARVSPRVNTQYRWRYAGSSTRRASTSAVDTVAVRQVVQAAVRPGRVARQTRARVYGTVRPAGSGQLVYLQRRVHGAWKTLAIHARIRRQRMPDHTRRVGFVIAVKERRAGTYRFRVLRPATATNAAGTSSRVILKVHR